MCDPISIGLMVGGSIGQQILNSGSEDRALNAQMRGAGAAENALNSTLDKSTNALKEGAENLKSLYQPWVDSGNTATKSYQDLITGKTDITQSPIYQNQANLLNQQMAKMGISQSPTSVMQNYLPLMASAYQTQASLLNPLMQYGYNATGNVANSQNNLASNLANLYSTYGSNIANLETNKGDITANSILSTTPQFGNQLYNFGNYMFKNPGSGTPNTGVVMQKTGQMTYPSFGSSAISNFLSGQPNQQVQYPTFQAIAGSAQPSQQVQYPVPYFNQLFSMS